MTYHFSPQESAYHQYLLDDRRINKPLARRLAIMIYRMHRAGLSDAEITTRPVDSITLTIIPGGVSARYESRCCRRTIEEYKTYLAKEASA